MSAKVNPIDITNELLWQSRFGDSAKVAYDALDNLEKAEKTKYPKGIAYANLTIAAANFYQSKNDVALKHLSESFHWFEENKEEKKCVFHPKIPLSHERKRLNVLCCGSGICAGSGCSMGCSIGFSGGVACDGSGTR